VLIYDADERLHLVNAAARRMLGLSHDLDPEALTVEHLLATLAQRAEDRESVDRALCPPDSRDAGIELRLAEPERWLSCDPSLQVDHRGEVIARLVILRDCTDWKLQEQAWRRRLRATAHDLRTPLTNVKAYSQLALMRLRGLPEETRQIGQVVQSIHCLETINAQSSAMAALLSQTLD
jgi:signal transduction histidine kinase